MKAVNFLKCCSLIAIISSTAFAEEGVDRSQRTSAYPNTPSYAQGGNSSRYDTSNGWSRGGSSWYWGNRGSDIPTSGYTAPVNGDNGPRHSNHNSYSNNNSYDQRCGAGKPVVIVNTSPKIAQNSVRPSCGSGTVFDGHGCKITDNRLRKTGGDGYINPCSDGTHFSNGRCVR